MSHTARRNIRLLLTVIHLILQILMSYYVFSVLGDRFLVDENRHLQIIFDALKTFVAMFGLFAIYYSLMQLLSRRNQPVSHSHK